MNSLCTECIVQLCSVSYKTKSDSVLYVFTVYCVCIVQLRSVSYNTESDSVLYVFTVCWVYSQTPLCIIQREVLLCVVRIHCSVYWVYSPTPLWIIQRWVWLCDVYIQCIFQLRSVQRLETDIDLHLIRVYSRCARFMIQTVTKILWHCTWLYC